MFKVADGIDHAAHERGIAAAGLVHLVGGHAREQQAVERLAGEHVQLRATKGLQGLAGVQLCKQLQATHQRTGRRSRRAADQQASPGIS